jgi:Putative Ig domain
MLKRLLIAPALLFAVPNLALSQTPQMAIAGVPEVGSALSPTVAIPAGSTCSWARNGTPVSTSCVSYTVQSADAGATLTLRVTTAGLPAYAALAISGTPPPTGTVGTAYSFTPTASNGSGGYMFSETGALPPGLSFSSSTGALSGTPTRAGTFAGLAITATDSVGGSATLAANPFTITINGGGGGGSPNLDFSQASNSQYFAITF